MQVLSWHLLSKCWVQDKEKKCIQFSACCRIMSVIRHFIAAIIKISKEAATRSSFKRLAFIDS